MDSEADTPRNKGDTREATITTVFETGPNGPYFVAVADGMKGSITCSSEPPIWQEDRPPRVRDVVILGELSKTGGGLRANTGRLWRLSDDDL